MISLISLIRIGTWRCSPLILSFRLFEHSGLFIHSNPFGPPFRGARLDGLGGGGFGGRGEGGRSRDWHTAEALSEVHDAIVVGVSRRSELLSEQRNR